MVDQSGNEVIHMTKEEADASVEEMGNMMDYFDATCEHCGEQRKNCNFDTCESFKDFKET